jgi:hypothetical protein
MEARDFADLRGGNSTRAPRLLPEGISTVDLRVSPLDVRLSECPSLVTQAAARGESGRASSSYLSEVLDLLVTTRSCAGSGTCAGTSATWLRGVELTLLQSRAFNAADAPSYAPLAPTDLAFVLRHLQWV